jgi:thymidylate kinase
MNQKKKHLESDSTTHIAIVGPCGAGKSTLALALKERGYDARQIAQEHSYVPSMWQIITNPDILIYLDVSYQPGTRRKQLNWTLKEFNEQIRRLVHARENCAIYIHTDALTPAEVLAEVLGQL